MVYAYPKFVGVPPSPPPQGCPICVLHYFYLFSIYGLSRGSYIYIFLQFLSLEVWPAMFPKIQQPPFLCQQAGQKYTPKGLQAVSLILEI